MTGEDWEYEYDEDITTKSIEEMQLRLEELLDSGRKILKLRLANTPKGNYNPFGNPTKNEIRQDLIRLEEEVIEIKKKLYELKHGVKQ